MTVGKDSITHSYRQISRSTVIDHNDNSLTIALANNVGIVLSSAAFPISIVVVCLIFRRELADLIGRIRSFKALGMEASVDAVIQSSLPPVPLEADRGIDVLDAGQFASPTRMSSHEEIIAAWDDVERALRNSFSAKSGIGRASLRSLVQAIGEFTGAPTGLQNRVEELYSIRNRVARSPDAAISYDSINLYRENAARAVRELEGVTDR